MGSASERNRLRSFADVLPPVVVASTEQPGYNQLTFEGVTEERNDVEIDNLLVTKQPTVRKTETGSVWLCSVTHQQDLWHQKDLGSFVLHASQHAEQAQALKLKLNDLILVRGVPWTQQITLRGGNVKTIQHLNVTDIQMVSRAPRATQRRRS